MMREAPSTTAIFYASWQTYTQNHPYAPTPIMQQWVLWHLIEHDLHHGGEISWTLGMYGMIAPPI